MFRRYSITHTFGALLVASALVLTPTIGYCALIVGQFLQSQAPGFGVSVNPPNLTINGVQFPIPPELDPVAATTIRLLPGGTIVASHRTPQVGDTCVGDSVQHMYHRVPAQGGQPLALIRTACLDQPRATEDVYDYGLSTQIITALREIAAPTSSDQRISFVALDQQPGVVASQLFTADIESVRFSPSGTVALVKYDLPGGQLDPADWRFIDLCPGTLGQTLANYADVGAGASAAVEDDMAGGYRVRFSHPSFSGGSVTFAVVDCLGAPPPPPPGEQALIVSLIGSGSGQVTSNPAGIDCPTTACQASFIEDTVVTLTATPDFGSSFVAWGGDCSGTAITDDVTLDQARSCTAEFSRPLADVGIACTLPSPLGAGAATTLTIDVNNAGPNDATNTDVDITLPAELAFDFIGSTPGCFDSFDGVSCDLGTLAANEQTTVTINLDTDPLGRGSVAAGASVDSALDDPATGDNTCMVSTLLEAQVDLSVDIDADPDPVAAGNLLAFQIEVSNLGPSAASNVTVSESLPAEVELEPSQPASCDLTAVYPGSTVQLTRLTRVLPNTPDASQLEADASASSPEMDLDPSNNAAMTSVTVDNTIPPNNPGEFVRLASSDVGQPGTIFDLSVPAQSGPYTAFFGQESDESVYLSAAGQVWPAYVGDQSLNGLGGSFINIGIFHGPTLDGTAQAWLGQYGNPTFDRFQQTSVAWSGNCAPEELLNERSLGATRPADWLILNGVSLAGGRVAVSSVRDRDPQVFIRETDGSFTILADNSVELPGADPGVFMRYVPGLAFNGNQVAFHAGSSLIGRCDVSFDECDLQGIYKADSGGISVLADTNTAIPGGTGTFAGFMWFGGQISISGDSVVFLGYDDQRRYGIYLHDGAQLSVIVDYNTQVPGETGNFAYLGVTQVPPDTDFPFSAPALDGDTVAFLGALSGGERGIYLHQNGTLRRVIQGGELINGDRADNFRLGPQALSDGTLAFWATVADGPSAPGTAGAIYKTSTSTNVIFADGFE